MSKELEALENMKNGADDWYRSYEMHEDYPVIKSALQRLEKYEEIKPILVGILEGCKLRYEATHEPNMRLYMSKELCEKIDEFLKRLYDEQHN